MQAFLSRVSVGITADAPVSVSTVLRSELRFQNQLMINNVLNVITLHNNSKN